MVDWLMEFRALGKTGDVLAAVGMGTWKMENHIDSIESLKRGIELGSTFIDTAEMYGNGHVEEMVAEAIRGVREKVFIGTKVSPDNLSYDDLLRAAERSLRRLNISTIDLYQVHWPNSEIPIRDSMRAMEHLVNQGKVRFIGVSNFSSRQTNEAQEALSRHELVSNQVEYSILERGVEKDLVPYCQKEHINIIAYSPLARERIFRGKVGEELESMGKNYGKTSAQIALNWLLTKPGVVTIPKASKISHLEENINSIGWKLSPKDEKILDELSMI